MLKDVQEVAQDTVVQMLLQDHGFLLTTKLQSIIADVLTHVDGTDTHMMSQLTHVDGTDTHMMSQLTHVDGTDTHIRSQLTHVDGTDTHIRSQLEIT